MLTLDLLDGGPGPLEVAGLLPRWTRTRGLAEIERFNVRRGNRAQPLAEAFRISGDPADAQIFIRGDCAHIHRIGEGLDEGTIRVEGNAGRHLGSGMRGGEIHVQGSVSDFAGCEMSGGTLRIAGDAGDYAGSAYAGSHWGMRGGALLIAGRAGDEAATRMRRGLLAIGQDAGAWAGHEMHAGSLLVFGSCGERPGAGMRRGTIALFGSAPPLLPTFRPAWQGPMTIMRMVLSHLNSLGFLPAAPALDRRFSLYHGDLLAGGRGEILVASDA